MCPGCRKEQQKAYKAKVKARKENDTQTTEDIETERSKKPFTPDWGGGRSP